MPQCPLWLPTAPWLSRLLYRRLLPPLAPSRLPSTFPACQLPALLYLHPLPRLRSPRLRPWFQQCPPRLALPTQPFLLPPSPWFQLSQHLRRLWFPPSQLRQAQHLPTRLCLCLRPRPTQLSRLPPSRLFQLSRPLPPPALRRSRSPPLWLPSPPPQLLRLWSPPSPRTPRFLHLHQPTPLFPV